MSRQDLTERDLIHLQRHAQRLVHGDPERAAALADGLRGIGFTDVAIPDRGESATI